MRTSEEIVAAARACVGARFRLHGRDPAFGLDCAGVAAVAFGRDVRADYPARGGTAASITVLAGEAGLRSRKPADSCPGDLALIDAGSGQLHLVVLTPAGFVHADARLRRVVEAPGAAPGRMVAAWTGQA